MQVPQQKICTTQENDSKSYFLYTRYYASQIQYDLLFKFFRFIQVFVFLFRIPLDQYTPERYFPKKTSISNPKQVSSNPLICIRGSRMHTKEGKNP